MRFNPATSVYWLWLVVIASILGVVVAHAIAGDALSWSTLSDNEIILLWAAVSVVLAVVATVIHHTWANQSDPKSFGLRGLLLMVAGVVCVFSCLASLGVIPAIYAVVLIAVVGRIAILLLAAIGL